MMHFSGILSPVLNLCLVDHPVDAVQIPRPQLVLPIPPAQRRRHSPVPGRDMAG